MAITCDTFPAFPDGAAFGPLAPALDFRTEERDPVQGIKKRAFEADSDDDEKGGGIRCAGCRHRITRSSERTVVNGSHQHVFNNPEGYLFEIGCFRSAEGCVNQGMPTLEFTWFAGYAWRYALCGNCHEHLGWFYQSVGGGTGSGFYGLILAQLVEDRD